MRAYLFDEVSGGKIAEALNRVQVELVLPNQELVQSASSLTEIPGGQKYQSVMDAIDTIVLEITQPHPEANFLLAQAILQQKPTLCLYLKNREPRELLNYLVRKGAPKNISAKSYTETSVEAVVRRFAAGISGQPMDLDEIPSIKFTLRLPPNVDRYLNWKSKAHRQTKADLLRAWLRRKMEEDPQYRRKKS